MTIVMRRNTTTNRWIGVMGDGSVINTDYPSSMKAGDVWERVARLHPKEEIGFKSESFGPATVLQFGPVVWMRNKYELDTCKTCGHLWGRHAQRGNGTFACRFTGCQCRDVHLPS